MRFRLSFPGKFVCAWPLLDSVSTGLEAEALIKIYIRGRPFYPSGARAHGSYVTGQLFPCKSADFFGYSIAPDFYREIDHVSVAIFDRSVSLVLSRIPVSIRNVGLLLNMEKVSSELIALGAS